MSAEVWNLVGGVWVIKSVELCNLVRLNKLVENWILVRLNKSVELEIKFSWAKWAWRNLQSNRVEKIEGKLIESDEF